MMAKLRRRSIQRWLSDFLDTLQRAQAERNATIEPATEPATEPAAEESAAEPSTASTPWPLRSVSAR
jgi:hypothetical protein